MRQAGNYKRDKKLAWGMVSLLALTAALDAQAAAPAAGEARQKIQLEAQSVGDALLDLAMQLGVEVLLFGDDEGSIQVTKVNGRYTPSEALQKLLAGTGLHFRYTNDGAIFVGTPERLSTALAEAEESQSYRQAMFVQPDEGGDSIVEVAPAADEWEEQRDDQITVTGSRIARSGFDTPTPVTVLDNARIQMAAVSDIGDLLLQTPAIAVGENAVNANFSQDAGASFVNLRGMGTDRTLVLVDGRRRVSGGQSLSAVDLATIPANLIDRVETITGGASAVYGADAVTGVVNVILKDDFEGLQLSARGNLSQDAGADNYSLGLLTGAMFDDDKGSITFGVSYDRSTHLRPHQRYYTDGDFRTIPNPANTGPNDGIPNNIHVDEHRLPGLVRSGAFYLPDAFAPVSGDFIYTYDNGALRPTMNDLYYQGRTGFSAVGGADGFSVAEMNQLRPDQKVLAAITRFNYAVADNIDLYAHAEFANTQTLDNTQPFFDTPGSIIIDIDNPLVPEEVRQLMVDNGLTEFSVSRFHHDQGTQQEEIERNTISIDTGLKGVLPNGWNWDVFVQYGRYRAHKSKYTRIEDRFYNAIDAIELDGEIVCADPAARAEGCVPLSLFGANAATPEAIDYMKHYRLQDLTNTMKTGGAQLNGDLFSLPAGPLQFALGTEYREETASFRNDGLAITNQLFRFDNGQVNSDASFDVYEGFVEVLAPLLRDQPFFHALNFEGAMRYSDYSHVDETFAWKLGGDWSPIPDVRFRVTRSKSVRAPNLSETFNPGNIQNLPNSDPCAEDQIDESPTRRANCEALGVPLGFDDEGAKGDFGLIGGNPNLKPEEARSWTIGAVLEPSFLPRFRASVDYWDIAIAGAINTPNIQTIVDRCVDLPTIDNVFCSLIQRRPDFEIEFVRVTDANIGKLTARGVDFQAQYVTEAPFVPGDLNLYFNGTLLLEHEELFDASDPTTLIIRTGETSHPKFRGTLVAGWDNGPVRVDILTRLVGSATVDKQAAPELNERPTVNPKVYNDIIVGYNFSEKVSLTAGVKNLFYVIPPRTAATYRGNFQSGGLYDVIGRTFFVGVKANF